MDAHATEASHDPMGDCIGVIVRPVELYVRHRSRWTPDRVSVHAPHQADQRPRGG